ncbi:MAG: class I SAM-dependent methyltransferase [Caldilineaceae bacterium]|nr:class I SAM-dependent methyltransferase [Caldilineaceae bacterium]
MRILEDLGHHKSSHTADETDVVRGLATAFRTSPLPLAHQLSAFTRHVRRQDIARFLVKYELFKLVETINGSVVECGVFAGGGLMAWHHFSSILEPYNHTRKIIGFDTFDGFPSLHEQDLDRSDHLYRGAFSTHDSIESELSALIDLHDRNRPLGHISKVELVAGDATETIPQFVEDNPHLLLSLLYLDFDLYEPTKIALELLLPRVTKGGVVAFDELNCPMFPGETVALMESVDLQTIQLHRFPFDPYISYFVVGE